MSILLRSQARPFRLPELFVEQAGEEEPASSVRVADEGRAAWLRIFVRKPDGKARGALTLTLVDGDRSAEFVASPPQARK